MLRLFGLPVLTLVMALTFAEFDLRPTPEFKKGISQKNYPEHLTGTFTGGFGEETCRSCHFDYDLNPKGGNLSVAGIPQQLSAGETIEIIIKVKREKLGAAGFQLSTRYKDGSQAGRFMVKENDRIMVTQSANDSLQYIQHTNAGTTPSQENKTSWQMRWHAPKSPKGMVVFNIAANAANGDQSEFGDFIYAKEVKVEF